MPQNSPIQRLANELLHEIADRLEEQGLEELIQKYQVDDLLELFFNKKLIARPTLKPSVAPMALVCRKWHQLVTGNRRMWFLPIYFGTIMRSKIELDKQEKQLQASNSSDLLVWLFEPFGDEYAAAAMTLLKKYGNQVRSFLTTPSIENGMMDFDRFHMHFIPMQDRLTNLHLKNSSVELGDVSTNNEYAIPYLPNLRSLQLSHVPIPHTVSILALDSLHINSVRVHANAETLSDFVKLTRMSRNVTLSRVTLSDITVAPPQIPFSDSFPLTTHLTISNKTPHCHVLLHIMDLRGLQCIKLNVTHFEIGAPLATPSWILLPQLPLLTEIDALVQMRHLDSTLALLEACWNPSIRRVKITISRHTMPPRNDGTIELWNTFAFTFTGNPLTQPPWLGYVPPDAASNHALLPFVNSPSLVGVCAHFNAGPLNAQVWPDTAVLRQLPASQVSVMGGRPNRRSIEEISFLRGLRIHTLDLSTFLWQEQRNESWEEVWVTLVPDLNNLHTLSIRIPKAVGKLKHCINACRSLVDLTLHLEHKAPVGSLKYLGTESKRKPLWLPELKKFKMVLEGRYRCQWHEKDAVPFAKQLREEVEERERLGSPLDRIHIVANNVWDLGVMRAFEWFDAPRKGFSISKLSNN